MRPKSMGFARSGSSLPYDESNLKPSLTTSASFSNCFFQSVTYIGCILNGLTISRIAFWARIKSTATWDLNFASINVAESTGSVLSLIRHYKLSSSSPLGLTKSNLNFGPTNRVDIPLSVNAACPEFSHSLFKEERFSLDKLCGQFNTAYVVREWRCSIHRM